MVYQVLDLSSVRVIIIMIIASTQREEVQICRMFFAMSQVSFCTFSGQWTCCEQQWIIAILRYLSVVPPLKIKRNAIEVRKTISYSFIVVCFHIRRWTEVMQANINETKETRVHLLDNRHFSFGIVTHAIEAIIQNLRGSENSVCWCLRIYRVIYFLPVYWLIYNVSHCHSRDARKMERRAICERR